MTGHQHDIVLLLSRDPERVRLLRAVRNVCGGSFWIGAGFVRNVVWADLHGQTFACGDLADIDVVVWRPAEDDPAWEAGIEQRLRRACPAPWSVTNQGRMWRCNGHEPYRDLADALGHWPETATAIACRLRAGGRLDAGDRLDAGETIELLAPHGAGDLLAGIIRPTPAYAGRPEVVLERAAKKRWLERWPRLRLARGDTQ